jgi:hypothetical protein
MNKAHALMFLGRADESLALYRKWRGHIDVNRHIWKNDVRADFARFRSLGMDHPQMAEIEKELAGGPEIQ